MPELLSPEALAALPPNFDYVGRERCGGFIRDVNVERCARCAGSCEVEGRLCEECGGYGDVDKKVAA